MKFKCPLIVVNNIHAARDFYENVLNQKVKYDFGENVVYEGDFSIQLKSHFANMTTINQDDITPKSNNFELYFEEENIDSFVERLNYINQIKYIHGLIEHPWGQRVIRFYDPDMHIIEVGESMESVAKRFLSQGLSIEETAKRTQHPIEFVRKCLDNITIKQSKEEDINSIVSIWNEVIDEGNSFFWREHFSNNEISQILNSQKAVYCAKYNEEIIGFYILHDNFPGRGNHVSNALYAIKKEFRGKGIGKMLGEHSIKISKECGYKAMQFNSVVSTNIASVNLWESLGFTRVGQINNAFIKDNNDVVDIYIYHKSLY